jgi:hypothetical protein
MSADFTDEQRAASEVAKLLPSAQTSQSERLAPEIAEDPIENLEMKVGKGEF